MVAESPAGCWTAGLFRSELCLQLSFGKIIQCLLLLNQQSTSCCSLTCNQQEEEKVLGKPFGARTETLLQYRFSSREPQI